MKKILIIDDDPDIVTFLSTWLEDHGYQTCTAQDGDEGLALAFSEAPDLIFLDLKMPNKTGVQFYRTLHLENSLKKIPVMFITGVSEFHTFDDDCEPLPEPAARIEKPIDTQELYSAIKRIIG